MPAADKTPSPCVSRCALGAGDFCLGCQRPLADIVEWSSMGEAGRAAAARRAAWRRAWTKRDGRARAIMALGPAGEAGLRGGLPWSLPAELAWFKQATAGQALLMGRSTWNGLRKALPGRKIAVVGSREPEGLQAAPGAAWARSVEEGLDWAFDQGANPCLAGGPALWASSWGIVELAWITRVEGPMEADAVWLPDLSGFEQVAEGPDGAQGPWRWRASLWARSGSEP